MCKIFEVDIGNSDSKTVSESGAFSLKNIISPGRERRLYEDEKGAYADYLDVTIESKGLHLGSFFVGDLALREGGQYTREKHMGSLKAENTDTYVLLLVSIALYSFFANFVQFNIFLKCAITVICKTADNIHLFNDSFIAFSLSIYCFNEYPLLSPAKASGIWGDLIVNVPENSNILNVSSIITSLVSFICAFVKSYPVL